MSQGRNNWLPLRTIALLTERLLDVKDAERENGMLRRYVPKGVSIESFSDKEILWVANALSSLPHRNLGHCTPEELFEAFLDTVYAA